MRRSEGDDVGLLLAAASGDDRAFGEFYRRWLPLVTGYHLRRSRSRELAFDLTAETFAAVVADLQRFDPDRGSPAGWLFEIAEHKLLDSARRARVESSARTRLGHEPVVLDDCDLERVEELASIGTPVGWTGCSPSCQCRNAMPSGRVSSTSARMRRSRARWIARRRSCTSACLHAIAQGARWAAAPAKRQR